MNICFTVNLELNDKVFDDLKYFHKVHISAIADKYKYDLFSDDTLMKYGYLVQEIKSINADILIQNAFYDLNDLKVLISLLNKEDLEIYKIFIPSVSRRIARLIEGQEMYSNFSRWLDFYPGQIEEIHESREKKYLEINEYFTDKKTAVIEI